MYPSLHFTKYDYYLLLKRFFKIALDWATLDGFTNQETPLCNKTTNPAASDPSPIAFHGTSPSTTTMNELQQSSLMGLGDSKSRKSGYTVSQTGVASTQFHSVKAVRSWSRRF